MRVASRPTDVPTTAAIESARPTPLGEVDRAVDEVQAHAEAFGRLGERAAAALLRECIEQISRVAPEWTATACRAKGLRPGLPEASEEWIGGPLITIRSARLLAMSLEAIDRRRLPLGAGWRVRADGRLEIAVFPTSRLDASTYVGYRGTVVMLPGIDAAEARQRQGGLRRPPGPARVCAVLGAGNVAAIPATDVMHKLFAEGRVCVLKMNPVNEWLGPILTRGLSPLIREGFVRIVYGGAEEGARLVGHPGVEDVHITGSASTYDAIVWGPPGAERERRLRDGNPLLRKPVSAELGNVSPVLIVPGRYSSRALRFQARAIASSVVNNASFNCNASKVLVVARAWEQRELFIRLLLEAMARVAPRPAYYPGAQQRYEDLLAGHEVVQVGQPAPGRLPWALMRDLDASAVSERAFLTEPFCPVISEAVLAAADPEAFLGEATAFCNERLWGTLSAEIVTPPDRDLDAAVERAVRDLRYGTVAVNVWPAVAFAAISPPWGGHPSSTSADIQSGLGWVHNTYLLDGIEKSVFRASLAPRLKPVWHLDHRTAEPTIRRMVDLERRPSWPGLGRVALAALRG